MHLVSILPLLVLILVVVGLRARRTMTSQPVRPTMLIVRIVILTLVGILLLFGLVPQISLLLGLGIGLAAGLALAFYSLKHTQFDNTGGEVRYKANPYLGGLVVLLLVLRMAVDFSSIDSILQTEAPAVHHALQWQQGPLSLALYFLFLTYWVFYYIGVLKKARALPKIPPAVS